ncbi:hypothetical protein NEIELOOT_00347 [Neisseria elongata subsp. glycolytica ATCC 29315]|uniref:Uncharacterized protein n=1 Tax=Neisseria elongata subsp. glycolytica ATCC 29315 TaxID=546263 RepID=D4DMS3_NEIEG|nr:hypothetical protein NEIELOOT_00347 [Neisseria elongata subsp. glycolytica ATCC 29315]
MKNCSQGSNRAMSRRIRHPLSDEGRSSFQTAFPRCGRPSERVIR